MKKVIIYIDGAARGNPGPAAIGAIIKDEKGEVQMCISQRIGTRTNNQAEYMALIAALEKAIEMSASQVEVNSDSELLVRQVTGQYRVRNPGLKPLFQRAQELRASLGGFTINHIPRERNRVADGLANMALDARD